MSLAATIRIAPTGRARLFAEPLPFEVGAPVLRPAPMPALDRAAPAAHRRKEHRHAPTRLRLAAV